MNYSQKNEKVFTIDERGIFEMTYGDFVAEFGSDETTTPNGVAPRKFIEKREVEVFVFNNYPCNSYEEAFDRLEAYNESNPQHTFTKSEIIPFTETVWQIRTWGLGGRGPSKLVEEFDTEEEAEKDLFERWEMNAQESDQTPSYYTTREEAQEAWDECFKD